MKLTKLEHACFTVEIDGKKVVVDPGKFSNFPDNYSDAVAVVFTHNHSDHFSQSNLDKVRAGSPDVLIFAAKEISDQIPEAVEPERGKEYEVGPFKLMFGGGMHAIIHPDYPVPHNVTVMINDTVYYPGDSYTIPNGKPKLVMVPINAPWAKVSEAMDFMRRVNAETFIPTHDAMLSEAGHGTYDAWLERVSEATGRGYKILKFADTIEV